MLGLTLMKIRDEARAAGIDRYCCSPPGPITPEAAPKEHRAEVHLKVWSQADEQWWTACARFIEGSVKRKPLETTTEYDKVTCTLCEKIIATGDSIENRNAKRSLKAMQRSLI